MFVVCADCCQSYGTDDNGSTNAAPNITANSGAGNVANVNNGNTTNYYACTDCGIESAGSSNVANEGGWPFTAKSDPKSWIFRTDKTNENVRSAGVTGIEFSRHDIRYNISSDVLTIVAIHIRLPTLYFEYPRITSIFSITNEVIDASWAALVMARATDRAINQLTDWVDGQENPTEWGTKIQFMKYLEGQVLKDFGRVTSVQNYSPIIVTPYKTL